MGFDSKKKIVGEGDVCIVFMGHDSMLSVQVKADEITQTKFGAIKHNKLIGHHYGTKFDCTKGWVYILNPTPELWTITLPHRTQILYAADISMITHQLELKPGSKVCECGTGSGSLSHAILRTISPNGFLHTVEFHEDRSIKARNEFTRHDFGNNVQVHHRDLLADGFPVENYADAIFLDLPRPDQAIHHAAAALKKTGGRLCSFSPCIEQVQRTCEKLHEVNSGFSEIETIEIVQRSHNVKRVNIAITNLGSSKDGDDGDTGSYDQTERLPVGEVILRTDASASDRGLPSKRSRMSDSKRQDNGDNNSKPPPPAVTKYAFSCRTCVSPREIYGHTGYLTFASYRAPTSSLVGDKTNL